MSETLLLLYARHSLFTVTAFSGLSQTYLLLFVVVVVVVFCV